MIFFLLLRTAEIIKISARLKQSGESKSLLNSFHGQVDLQIEFLINLARTARERERQKD